ncbi:MAG: hypothetical protein J0L92_34660 [Deltaproteobacteria bacterium]|nr:hypothetical protein [Deltaproteobacteria bacterium]
MSARLRLGLATALLGLLAVGGMAFAQAADDDDGQGEEAAVGVRRASDMTAADQVAEAQRILGNGQSLSVRVQGMLDQSRREGDVLRVTCLDDKLTQVNAHVRTLGDRVEALQEAVRLADEARRNHEYTVIIVLGQNLVVLDRSASECIGQDMYETGTTRVVTTIDPNTPDIDPTDLVIVHTEGVPFIPSPASGSM